MTETTAPAHFIGSCARKHVSRYTAAEWAAARIDRGNSSSKYGYAPCRECGHMVTVRAIRVRVTSKPCDARCIGATGPACDCSCGGANHGGLHSHLVTVKVEGNVVAEVAELVLF